MNFKATVPSLKVPPPQPDDPGMFVIKLNCYDFSELVKAKSNNFNASVTRKYVRM